MEKTNVMSTNVAKPAKVAIIGASGTYGKGILARGLRVVARLAQRLPVAFVPEQVPVAAVRTDVVDYRGGCDHARFPADRANGILAEEPLPRLLPAPAAAPVGGRSPRRLSNSRRSSFRCLSHRLLPPAISSRHPGCPHGFFGRQELMRPPSGRRASGPARP